MQNKHNTYSIHSMELGPMENFVYLIHDHATDTAAIVDPAWEIDQMLDYADAKEIQITDILLTHSHHDHINGLQQTLEHSDARVHLLKPEAKFWGAALDKAVLHHGGEQINIGDSQVNILHTPGHTRGGICLYSRQHKTVFVGDTLFASSIGRTDLPGGNFNTLITSIKEKLLTLPPATQVFTGHGPATTIEIEAKSGSLKYEIKNLPSKLNPKTSSLAIYSAIATLRKLFSHVRVGT